MPTVLIGGGSGLVGSRLSQLLSEKGFQVGHLSRTPKKNATYASYHWDAQKGEIDQAAVEGADYIINLAGAGIADRPWSEKRKKLIISSRVNTTLLLRDAIQQATNPPKAFISSSATGYYGSRADQIMTEKDQAGTGFLSDSCIAWENAAHEVANTGIPTKIIRTGVVLSTRGGALPKMTMPIQFFAGVYFADGQQWMPWIHIDDLCRIFIHVLENKELSGIFNGVAPNPVQNKTLIKQTAAVKDKPVIMLPAPAFALKLILGEMSHVLLDSTRASSKSIEAAGFHFNFPDLAKALADLFRRKV